MGAWNDFVITEAVLNGLSPIDWPQKNGAYEKEIEASVVVAAKRLVRTHCRSLVAKYYAGLGGEEGFFDAVAEATECAEMLTECIGYAYLAAARLDASNRPGRGQLAANKSKQYTDLLKAAVKGLAALAPGAIARDKGEQKPGRRPRSMVVNTQPSWG